MRSKQIIACPSNTSQEFTNCLEVERELIFPILINILRSSDRHPSMLRMGSHSCSSEIPSARSIMQY